MYWKDLIIFLNKSMETSLHSSHSLIMSNSTKLKDIAMQEYVLKRPLTMYGNLSSFYIHSCQSLFIMSKSTKLKKASLGHNRTDEQRGNPNSSISSFTCYFPTKRLFVQFNKKCSIHHVQDKYTQCRKHQPM
jgi:hypothetical protein